MLDGLLDGLRRALIVGDRWKFYLEGLRTTLLLAGIACVIGVVIGLLVAVVKVYAANSKNPVLKVLNAVCTVYTTVIRGTPIVLQLLILYNLAAIPNGFTACIIGFSINSGAYVSEIIRGGINSIDVGQMEAGRSLGLSRNKTMRFIVLPQAVKNILPALFNEFIALVKETSVAGYIAVNDITKVSDGIRGLTFNITPLYITAAVYLTLVFLLTQVQRTLERRLAKSDRG